MIVDHEKIVRDFHYIVREDLYQVQDFNRNHFSFVLDIGANIGVFSALCKLQNPNAKVVAIEPSSIPFEKLLYLQHFGVFTTQVALGPGSDLHLNKRGSRDIDWEFVEEDTGFEAVPSMSLGDMFEWYAKDTKGNYLIKLDCEGGERFLLGDKKAEGILYDATQVSMEVHFNTGGREHLPGWQAYDEWIKRIFTSHEVSYYCSSKKSGYGHYCIRRQT